MPRPGGQTADDGDGRGNHQGAGAGNDQQHQRLIGGLHPGQPHEPRSQQRNGNGQDKHRRRVDGGKAIHETLGGGAGGLGLLNGVDDARQRAVGSRRRNTDFQRRSLIDGAGEDFIARALVHRQAFAGHGGLVNGALAQGHDAIQRKALAGANTHRRAHSDFLDADACPTAVVLTHFGLLRRERQQALDGTARPIHGARLDGFRNGIQGHHHRRFGPLADQKSAGHGHGHQGIDVQAALSQRGQSLAVNRETRQRDGRRSQCHSQRLDWHAVWEGECQAFGRHGEPQGAQRLAPGRPEARWRGNRSGSSRRPGIAKRFRLEACLADRVHRLLQDRIIGGNGQLAVAQIELQATNSRHAVQRPADFRLLRGTVHVCNAEALGILRAEGFWLETRFADRFQGLGQRVVIGGNGKLSIP